MIRETTNQTPYEIIDCHYHPGLDDETDTNWFGPSGSIQEQIDTLKRAGISRACGAPVKWFENGSFSEIKKMNDQAIALRDRFPDFYIPGIQVHPCFPQESCREIEDRCKGQGVRWIGELVGYMMGYGCEYATKDAIEIMTTASSYGAVVNFHCSELDVIDQLCIEVPSLKIVLAHPGNGKEAILNRLAKVAEHPNLHLDTSGSGIDRYGVIQTAVDTAGIGKLIFGTDYPINNPSVYIHGILLESLSEEENRALFGGNFLRLISN